jgi:hypothetical protein
LKKYVEGWSNRRIAVTMSFGFDLALNDENLKFFTEAMTVSKFILLS